MKELKISDLQHPYTTNDSILLNAINKMIKQNNKIEKWINRQEEPCGDFIPNEMQNSAINMEYINIDDIAIIEKEKPKQSWQKKLEEADNYEVEKVGYETIKTLHENDIDKIWVRYDWMHVKIKLLKQVISELIKDNEELEDLRFKYRKLINESEDQARQNIYKMKLEEKEINDLKQQLQQKQPDQEIIEWLERILIEHPNNFHYTNTDCNNAKKFLKYFKEIK